MMEVGTKIPPSLILRDRKLIARGTWQIQHLAKPEVLASLENAVKNYGNLSGAQWDLSAIDSLDHICAQWFWDKWEKRLPQNLQINSEYENLFKRIAQTPATTAEKPKKRRYIWHKVWDYSWDLSGHVMDLVLLLGQLILDVFKLIRNPRCGPWKEISANIYRVGYQALSVTALVAVLIGVVLSYLSAQQLHTFGADVYIVNLLGMSVVRELGPLLAAILIAGRSGSSITAQIGVMRVTEELDAMLVMGMPHGFRLIMPKVIALAIAMPLLVIWTDIMALIGGMGAAYLELGLSPTYFMLSLSDAVPIANFWIGLLKGVVFGILIALIACHLGLRIKPNTESLGHNTTVSVVASITVVILADAVFAIVFQHVGF